jgi:2,4-dienoyl-CoA reductase-like NADH-dependent reductase (Old Yellow Enzyme family)
MSTNPLLFEPLSLRGITLPNRIAVSPLCMYSAIEGMAQPWHFAHLSTFARGKAGLVFTEATAVEARGRITPECLGIWTDDQAQALKPITQFIESMDSVPGIQLAHAGRKASVRRPFSDKPGSPLNEEDAARGEPAWQIVAPSDEAVGPGFPAPLALDQSGLDEIKDAFVQAARRSVNAGFKVIELHMAHGYLLHSFLSPLSNHRSDGYGGDIEGRMRFALEVAEAVRAVIPDDYPLFSRISAIDGIEGGWSMDDSIVLCQAMADLGVDVVDCSSGGISGAPSFRVDDDGKPLTRSSARKPGFQVPYAERARKETDIKSMAVGVIIEAHQAEQILQSGGADLVALGREIMHDPFWPLHAAEILGADPNFKMWPQQYAWAVDRRSQIARLNRE